MYRHILIATDGSERAAKGVEHGFALARQLQAKATVLTVSEPINTGFDDALGWSAVATSLPDFQNARDEAARKVLDAATEQAEQAGVTPQRASTSLVWLPNSRRPSARRPCEAMTIRSQPSRSAVSTIASAA